MIQTLFMSLCNVGATTDGEGEFMSIWRTLVYRCAPLTIVVLSTACSAPSQVTPNGSPGQAQAKPGVASALVSAKPPTKAEFESWRSMIERIAKPENACLAATYPQREWREIPCVKSPNTPLLPAHGVRGATAGDGMDFSAAVTGAVSLAQGGFQDITGVKREYARHGKQRIPNLYSLQLNTQFFTTESCKNLGSPDPSQCLGWEQFAYDTEQTSGYTAGLFIEYWLVNFGPLGTSCPSGWNTFVFTGSSAVNCWINSANTIPIPVEPITSLGELRVLGGAAHGSRSQDFAEVIVGYSDVYYVAGQNWFPDLDTQWQIAEFNVFGDSNGDQAVFNSGSTIVVRTEVDSGAAMAPACDQVGFTGESNNLFLTRTRQRWPKDQYPSIVFTETNAAHRKQASCAPERSRG
jgi:hypothetical protein